MRALVVVALLGFSLRSQADCENMTGNILIADFEARLTTQNVTPHSIMQSLASRYEGLRSFMAELQDGLRAKRVVLQWADRVQDVNSLQMENLGSDRVLRKILLDPMDGIDKQLGWKRMLTIVAYEVALTKDIAFEYRPEMSADDFIEMNMRKLQEAEVMAYRKQIEAQILLSQVMKQEPIIGLDPSLSPLLRIHNDRKLSEDAKSQAFAQAVAKLRPHVEVGPLHYSISSFSAQNAWRNIISPDRTLVPSP